MSKAETEISTQDGSVQKQLFNDSSVVDRYKLGEPVTGAFGLELLAQIGLHDQKDPIHLLDLASGTGIIPKHAINILNKARGTSSLSAEDHFTCMDLSPVMLDVQRSRIGSESWAVDSKQIDIKQGDMKDTKLPANTFSHITCNFGPALAPQPEKTLQESFRVLRPGGIAGWTTWCKVGWYPDMQRAIADARDTAARKIEDGTADSQDHKLSKLSDLQPWEEMAGNFAGLNLKQLRSEGVKEEDLPRWDDEAFFRSQVIKAGFEDVKVIPVSKDFYMDYESSTMMTGPIVAIWSTFWTPEQREELEGVDIAAKLMAWWDRRFKEDDVRGGKIPWAESKALVVTGRKPA